MRGVISQFWQSSAAPRDRTLGNRHEQSPSSPSLSVSSALRARGVRTELMSRRYKYEAPTPNAGLCRIFCRRRRSRTSAIHRLPDFGEWTTRTRVAIPRILGRDFSETFFRRPLLARHTVARDVAAPASRRAQVCKTRHSEPPTCTSPNWTQSAECLLYVRPIRSARQAARKSGRGQRSRGRAHVTLLAAGHDRRALPRVRPVLMCVAAHLPRQRDRRAGQDRWTWLEDSTDYNLLCDSAR